jgi:ribosomal protein S6--L-glutamate ligase
MRLQRKVIALESRLRQCRNVITLGVHTNFDEYSPKDRDQIRKADIIYYPTTFYADLFNAIGKNTFPSYHTYKCVQDKIKQTALFNLLRIPHPRTRIFYGNRQKQTITNHFEFPFIAKIARGSARGRGVFLIRDRESLQRYIDRNTVAYVQEYLPIDRDMRVVVIGRRIVHAYWRIAPDADFRSNVSLGASISLDPLPETALKLAEHTAQACGWNDVGIDVCQCKGDFYVLEGNMKYGREGFRKAGIDYSHLMEAMIECREI